MTRPLGTKQRDLLWSLSGPSRLVVVGDSVSASMVKLGLLCNGGDPEPDKRTGRPAADSGQEGAVMSTPTLASRVPLCVVEEAS